jgi:hypothetical protein
MMDKNKQTKETNKAMNQEQNTAGEGTAVMEQKNFLVKLKDKWGLESLWQVIVVLVVFSLTGSSVVFLRKEFFSLIGFDENTAMWLKTVTYILFIMPAYQLLLLAYGTLLGQFRFFWEKEKKMFRSMGRLFKRKK